MLLLLIACTGKDEGDSGQANTGPLLEHTPPAAVLEGTPLSFTVTATDPDAVETVVLYHRVQGTDSWSQRNMSAGEGDDWSTTLDAGDVDAPGVEYYFKASDAADVSAISYLPDAGGEAPLTVAVNVLGLSLPFYEDFEPSDTESPTVFGIGWGNSSEGFAGYTWALSGSQVYSGESAVFHARGYDGVAMMQDWLISPPLDFSTLSAIQTSWYEYGNSVEEGRHGLYISTGSKDPADGDFQPVAETLPTAPDGAWGRSTVYDLSAWAGNPVVYLAWYYEGSNGDDWYIDDITVGALSPDLSLVVSASPSPLNPGDSGTLTVTLSNATSVAASDIDVVVSFPSGGASVAEPSVTVADVTTTGTADFSLTIDSDATDNSYLPVHVEASGGGLSWSTDAVLLIGEASTASFTWTPEERGYATFSLGVGDPDAPTWESEVYAGEVDVATPITADITDQHALLPPMAGDLRWFLRVDAEVDGSVSDLAIAHDGVDYTTTADGRISADNEAIIYLPEPPEFTLLSATTSPSTLEPGDSNVSLNVSVYNAGAETQGAVSATLTSTHSDLSVTTGGPVALSTDVVSGGQMLSTNAFRFDVAATHTDSSPLTATLSLTDGADTWDVPLSFNVPWPVMKITRIEIDDNEDGILEPGEDAEINLEVTNVGDMASSGAVSGVLSLEGTSTASATVTYSEENFGSLSVGTTGEPSDPFELEVDGSATTGQTLDLLLTLTDSVRTYEARVQLVLGEPPWNAIASVDDDIGDVLNGWQFDIINGSYRVIDDTLQLRLSSATPYAPETMFYEAWGTSSGADYDLYRIVLQSGIGTLEGYDYSSGFLTLEAPTVSYPDSYTVQLDISVEAMGLSDSDFTLGFGSGWCGSPDYYCDHFPNDWGYPYDSFSTGDWYTLSW